jgi:hypothetical protein
MRKSNVVLPWVLLALAASASAQTPGSTPKKGATLAPKKVVSISERIAPTDLTPEQLAVADRVALGKMPCELSANVTVRPDPSGPGRFVLELGKEKFYMAPVITATGAIRLEDPTAGAVWLQLGNKSMLMSQKLGKRLADACVSPDQAIVAKALELNPAPSLLDAAPVMQAGVAPAAVGAGRVATAAQPSK